MTRSFSLASQLAILAVTAGVCSFAASPTVLSGAALVSARGGDPVDCTVGEHRIQEMCAVAPGKMQCASVVLRCNFGGSPKIFLCDPKGALDSACDINVNCVNNNDDVLWDSDPECKQVM